VLKVGHVSQDHAGLIAAQLGPSLHAWMTVRIGSSSFRQRRRRSAW